MADRKQDDDARAPAPPGNTDEVLGPEEIAQLAAWFGEPAAALPPPTSADDRRAGDAIRERARHAPTLRPAIDPHVAEVRKTRERAAAAVDPDLLARLEAHVSAGDALVELPADMELTIERRLEKFDLSVWRLRLMDIREWDIPPPLYDDLDENTPQAILRDLHRPDLSWPLILRPMDLGMDIGGARARSQVDHAMRQSYHLEMKNIVIASRAGASCLEELRGRLDEPWENAYLSEEQRTSRESLPNANDLRWFGSMGYDPDL